MNLSAKELARAMSVAEAWAATDPNPQTKAETLGIINLVTLGDESGAEAIVSQFGSRIQFGTAGLRAELGAGPARMNTMVVMQTSAGFAEWLLQRSQKGECDSPPSVVIGFDARTYSNSFARSTAEVFAGYGLKVRLLPGPLPTPVTAFAVKHFGASAGVMITASHNPPKDNGYKVYLGDADGGSQIAPPVDAEISALIDGVASRSMKEVPLSPDYELVGDEIIEAYVESVANSWQETIPTSDIKVVYTAMHGVGADVTHRLFDRLGLPRLHSVADQETPDPTFPTVDFPNPEEPGALDLAFQAARDIEADLIIAHDPDADRLGVAVPDPNSSSGYTRLTGNDLGLLLGWQAAERFVASGGSKGSLACTIVSSPALGKVASHFGLEYSETLSGFKWVSRVPDLVFGFEEALGYLTRPNIVKDKDGISASADLLSLAIKLHSEGKTLRDRLSEASELFGAFQSAQITVRMSSLEEVRGLSKKIRRALPDSFGDFTVVSVQDMLLPGNSAVPADVLRFDLSGGARVMIRPSGTEPKLKLYLDTYSDSGDAKQRISSAASQLKELESSVRKTLSL